MFELAPVLDDRNDVTLYELDQHIEVVRLPFRVSRKSLRPHRTRSGSWYLWLLRTLHSSYEKTFGRFFGRVGIAQLSDQVSAEIVSAWRDC
jgi:hypothetical protein